MIDAWPGHVPAHLFDPHRRTVRSPEVIAAAFLECFTSPAGRIVWEALYDSCAMTQIADTRGLGRHDLFLEIEHLIGEGLSLQRRTQPPDEEDI